MFDSPVYPLRINGHIDQHPSRWLWLVKWLLAIPHLLVLAFLWIAMAFATLGAAVAIVVTGRYPRGLFDFNVGVLRWTWRVTFYAVVLGTDLYPPFALRSLPTFPADLVIDYPENMNRPLVLVKWLLLVPHFAITTVFGGGVTLWLASSSHEMPSVSGIGLVGVLALIAGVVLLFTKKYPHGIFEFVMGMERWNYRVLAYLFLMTDVYPPLRLDPGAEVHLDPTERGAL